MRKKTLYAGLIVMLALLSLEATCDKYAKAGQLAKDAAAGVLLAQQTEMALHSAGKIDDATHKAIEQKFLDLSFAGIRLDAAINQEHSATNATQALQVALTSVQDLSTQTIVGIKDQNTQLQLKVLLLAVQTTLNNIAAFAGTSAPVAAATGGK